MTTEQKCGAILRKMLELANAGTPVTIKEDLGDYTAKVCIGDDHHTHVGVPGSTWETLVDQMYSALHDGPGLSWGVYINANQD